jgi:OOP family OmpA-OmpF porin
VASQQDVGDGRVRVSVVDARKDAVTGLTRYDFAVDRDGVPGRIVSVEPVDQSRDVPRHTVLLVDNSFSMPDRGVTQRELNEAHAVITSLRPADDAQMVIYRDGKTVKMGDRALHVDSLKSNRAAELDSYAATACDRRVTTDNTYLYEGMVAGMELLKGTPTDGPRVLWVFSDGEELNSAFKSDVVLATAKTVPNLRVLAVDCMPGPKVDDFMNTLATQNYGQARKAGNTADLMALFQQWATARERYYLVSYEFPSAPAPVASAPMAAPPPVAMSTAKPATFEAAVLFDFNKSDLKPEGKAALQTYRDQARKELSSANSVKITGHTDSFGSAAYNQKLSVRRAQSVRDYLVSLGVDPKLLTIAGAGQTQPVADNDTAEGRAKNRRVEIDVSGYSK